MTKVLSVLSKPEIIEAITKTAPVAGLEIDDPQPWESMTDASDSPMGAQELQAGLELLTIAFHTAAAAAAFVAALIDLKRKLQPNESIRIVEPRTNETVLNVNHTTGDEDIRSSIKLTDS